MDRMMCHRPQHLPLPSAGCGHHCSPFTRKVTAHLGWNPSGVQRGLFNWSSGSIPGEELLSTHS